MAEQLYDANFSLIDIRELLKLILYALMAVAVLLGVLTGHFVFGWI